MTSNLSLILCVVLCGISLQTVFGQMGVFNSISNGNTVVGSQGSQTQNSAAVMNEDEDDEEDGDEDVMSRMNDVRSIEEFLTLLQDEHGEPVTIEQIQNAPIPDAGKLHIGEHEGRMATPDSCSPRNTTVRIEIDDTDSDVAYFPRCTKIERCGGCCSSPNVECVPSYTERVVLKVLKGRVPFPGAPHLEYSGFASKIEERHMMCHVRCKLNAESCGPKKNFLRRRCSCRCKVQRNCPPPTAWDPEDCSCKCPHVTPCCEQSDNCALVWSEDTCECVLASDGRVQIVANDQPSTTTATTTTSTTTTTTTTVGADPCDEINCPPRFYKSRSGNSCNCRFRVRRRGNRRG